MVIFMKYGIVFLSKSIGLVFTESVNSELTCTCASRSVQTIWSKRKENLLPKWKFCTDLNNNACVDGFVPENSNFNK